MIVAIGVDIVEINEIKSSITKSKRFIERVFTENEKNYCESKENKYQHYAARFAAKEAVMKALGTGWDKGVQWKQIEIRSSKNRSPEIILSGRANEIIQDLNIDKMNISLSHSRQNAIAVVTFEGFFDEKIYF